MPSRSDAHVCSPLVQSARILADGLARTPGFVLGQAVDGAGRLVVCDSGDRAVWVLAGDQLELVLTGCDDRGFRLPNYPAFGLDGTLYVTDSGLRGVRPHAPSTWGYDSRRR